MCLFKTGYVNKMKKLFISLFVALLAQSSFSMKLSELLEGKRDPSIAAIDYAGQMAKRGSFLSTALEGLVRNRSQIPLDELRLFKKDLEGISKPYTFSVDFIPFSNQPVDDFSKRTIWDAVAILLRGKHLKESQKTFLQANSPYFRFLQDPTNPNPLAYTAPPSFLPALEAGTDLSAYSSDQFLQNLEHALEDPQDSTLSWAKLRTLNQQRPEALNCFLGVNLKNKYETANKLQHHLIKLKLVRTFSEAGNKFFADREFKKAAAEFKKVETYMREMLETDNHAPLGLYAQNLKLLHVSQGLDLETAQKAQALMKKRCGENVDRFPLEEKKCYFLALVIEATHRSEDKDYVRWVVELVSKNVEISDQSIFLNYFRLKMECLEGGKASKITPADLVKLREYNKEHPELTTWMEESLVQRAVNSSFKEKTELCQEALRSFQSDRLALQARVKGYRSDVSTLTRNLGEYKGHHQAVQQLPGGPSSEQTQKLEEMHKVLKKTQDTLKCIQEDLYARIKNARVALCILFETKNYEQQKNCDAFLKTFPEQLQIIKEFATGADSILVAEDFKALGMLCARIGQHQKNAALLKESVEFSKKVLAPLSSAEKRQHHLSIANMLFDLFSITDSPKDLGEAQLYFGKLPEGFSAPANLLLYKKHAQIFGKFYDAPTLEGSLKILDLIQEETTQSTAYWMEAYRNFYQKSQRLFQTNPDALPQLKSHFKTTTQKWIAQASWAGTATTMAQDGFLTAHREDATSPEGPVAQQIKGLADEGNGNAARIYADLCKDAAPQEALIYYKKADHKGDLDAAAALKLLEASAVSTKKDSASGSDEDTISCVRTPKQKTRSSLAASATPTRTPSPLEMEEPRPSKPLDTIAHKDAREFIGNFLDHRTRHTCMVDELHNVLAQMGCIVTDTANGYSARVITEEGAPAIFCWHAYHSGNQDTLKGGGLERDFKAFIEVLGYDVASLGRAGSVSPS